MNHMVIVPDGLCYHTLHLLSHVLVEFIDVEFNDLN